MASFGTLKLTNLGIQAQRKAHAGIPLMLKRVGLGSGYYTGNIEDLTGLVKENTGASAEIRKGFMQNETYIIESLLDNSDLSVGFEWREIGVFAEDEDGNEFLYCYANAGDNYDYIPATSDERYSKHIRVAIMVSSNADVSIVETEGILYVDTLTFETFKDKNNAEIYDLGISESASGEVITANNSIHDPLLGMKVFGKTTQVESPTIDSPQELENRSGSVDMRQGTWSMNNGEFVSSTAGVCSKNAISCKSGDKIDVSFEQPLSYRCIFYKNGVYVGKETIDNVTSHEHIVPSGCDSFKFYVTRPDGSTITPQQVGKIVLRINENLIIPVYVYGRNLLPYPYRGSSQSTNDGVMTVRSDGGIDCSGTPTGYVGIILHKDKVISDKFTVCLLGNSKNVILDITINDANDETVLYTASISTNQSVLIDAKKYPEKSYLYISVKRSGNGLTMSGTAYPMVVAGDVAPTEYEPYKDPQILIAKVKDGLPGIPLGTTISDEVTSSEALMNGVWWCEEERQYYIGDTKEYDHGKYVQRVKRYELTGNETTGQYGFENGFFISRSDGVNGGMLSNFASYVSRATLYSGDDYGISDNFKYNQIVISLSDMTVSEFMALAKDKRANGTPFVFYYILAKPIEIDLPAEEIAAFKALHSNYPTTTIMNDCGAHMGVEYFKDTNNGNIVGGIFKKLYDVTKELEAMKNNAARVRIGEVSLLASKWTGSGSLYSQVVSIDGVTENSQVDLTPSVAQLAVFYEKDITLVTENVDGVVTVYAIGQKPANDYTIQVTMTEVLL